LREAALLPLFEGTVESRPQNWAQLLGREIEDAEAWRSVFEAQVPSSPVGEVDHVEVLVDQEAGDILRRGLVVQPLCLQRGGGRRWLLLLGTTALLFGEK